MKRIEDEEDEEQERKAREEGEGAEKGENFEEDEGGREEQETDLDERRGYGNEKRKINTKLYHVHEVSCLCPCLE